MFKYKQVKIKLNRVQYQWRNKIFVPKFTSHQKTTKYNINLILYKETILKHHLIYQKVLYQKIKRDLKTQHSTPPRWYCKSFVHLFSRINTKTHNPIMNDMELFHMTNHNFQTDAMMAVWNTSKQYKPLGLSYAGWYCVAL